MALWGDMKWRQKLRWPGLALWQLKCELVYAAAYVWRRLLFRTTFIAITGSVGKTTAKDCLAAILSARFSILSTRGSENDTIGLPRSILRVRPWHRFAVLEVAANGRGLMQRSAPLVNPHIALVLTVARTHMRQHKTLESVAAEKFELLKALRPDGIAVLNSDSPLVAAMAARSTRKVVWFGSSAASHLKADELSSIWPERFTFRLQAGGQSWKVRTQLVGTQWITSVLGALTVAQVCGVAPAEALPAIETVQPYIARMQPATVLDGITILRDEYNGSIDTLMPALRVLSDARSSRKILVISDVGDTSEHTKARMRLIADEAARVADLTVFISSSPHHALRAARHAGIAPDAVKSFLTLEQTVEYLKAELRAGDLLLLRGHARDHLSRIYFALLGQIKCWIPTCDLMRPCDQCPKLGARPGSSPRAR